MSLLLVRSSLGEKGATFTPKKPTKHRVLCSVPGGIHELKLIGIIIIFYSCFHLYGNLPYTYPPPLPLKQHFKQPVIFARCLQIFRFLEIVNKIKMH